MLRRRSRRVSLLTLLVVLMSLLTPVTQLPPSGPSPLAALLDDLFLPHPVHAEGVGDPPPPDQVTATPVPDPHLPTLSLTLDASPKMISVGSVCTLTITLTNLAPDAASNAVVSLPLPAGTASYPDPNSNPKGWTWTVPSLAAGATSTFTAVVSLTTVPTGNALLATPQVTATGLPGAITATGGAWVQVQSGTDSAVSFSPGLTSTLTSADSTTQVQVPSDAYGAALSLQFSRQAGAQDPVVTTAAGFESGFGAFYLNATNSKGAAVHQFNDQLTLTVNYTPEQLRALGLNEDNLVLYWFDTTQGTGGDWVPLGTDVDTTTHTVTAQVDHFSAFQLGGGTSPSAAFVPSLQGWQVGLYTGNVNYSYPIDVPAGPGGLKPAVTLSYNSADTDGRSGTDAKHQASWVGKGWSLQTGYVALNKITDDPLNSRYYSLVFNGQSFDLMRGECLPGTACTAGDPTQWAWHPTDESFLRARVVSNGSSTSGRGWFTGTNPQQAQPRYKWQIWTKDGTLYEFAEDTFWGWNFCPARTGYMEANKWYLSSVTDTHGNTITYSYTHATQPVSSSCNGSAMNGTNDYAIWPTTIAWGANSTTGTPNRYQVTFVSQARAFDTLAPTHGSSELGYAPQETRQLTQIQVSSMPTSTWQLMRAYNLTYYSLGQSLTSDASLCDHNSPPNCTAEGTPKLTLWQIQQIGSDGSSALPPTTFSYGTTRGTNVVPNGAWNRLTSVNNGHGGIATFTYDSVANAPDVGTAAGFFRNNRRLTSKTLNDGLGHTYTWTYDYAKPATNSLGSTQPGHAGAGPNLNTNSASVYYSEFVNSSQLDQNRALLIHPRYTEFRGHGRVIETDPNGNQTDHRFLQGDLLVNPTATAGNILTDSTFQTLQQQEFLKGRESDTIRYTGTVTNGQKLNSVHHAFTVEFYDTGQDVINGLWRAFSYESQQVEQTYEGGPTPLTKRTNYIYNPAGHESDGFQYGNLTEVDELDPNGAVYRRTFHDYTVLSTTTSYLADREVATYTKDGATPSGNWLALSFKLYDDGSYGTTGSKGELTRTCAVSNVSLNPLSTSLPAGGLICTDTHYHYYPSTSPSYGEAQYTSTYSDTSNATWTGGFTGASFATRSDNTATARTTTDSYDTTFPERLTQVTQPAGTGSVALVETSTYSPTLGVLMSVTDPNGNTTLIRYDVFGRQVKLIRPGDNETYPTVAGAYYDWNVPFRYQVLQRVSPTGIQPSYSYSVQRTFYDGLGRAIQTKQESGVNGQGYGTQMTVVDKRYDGLGQVIAQSQPWYSTTAPSNSPTDQSFWLYVQPTAVLTNATTTTYDGLGRPRVMTAPDNSATTTSYSLDLTHQVRVASTIDARGHQTDQGSDVFGRLARVVEYTGTNPSLTTYATTTYAYNPLDLLTGVTDQNGNQTTLNYDSLGHKINMTDPDMGYWQYQYDPNGNLTQQTDARGWPLIFSYDVRDRLTRIDYAAGDLSSASYTYDETSQANGTGQRTSMRLVARGDGANAVLTTWAYDARGHASRSDTTRWLVGTYTLQYTYDSADRPYQIIYPAFAGPGGVAETVTYAYDIAGRPTSLCSTATDVPGANHCYVSGASYTALDQPATRSLGNGVSETWSYESVMARLHQHQVSDGATLFNRTYSYDAVGNVSTITNQLNSEVQGFQYDPRDRLTDWLINNTMTEHYSYDPLGNLTSKAGVSYSYGATNNGPHQARTVGTQTYTYDQNGNLTGDGTRTYTIGPLNLPQTIIWAGHEEDYVYDPDGQRLYRSHNGVNTIYLDNGQVEVDYPNYTSRTYYSFNGQVVAQASKPNGGTRTLTWVHGDQLGSATLLTNSSGASIATQEFKPWGEIRSSSGLTTTTALNYTGQKLDGTLADGTGTGLLYYGARYYNPVLGRFTSPDSIVPGAASGKGGTAATLGVAQASNLTVDFHESQLVTKASKGMGPTNPEVLDRYSYVLNNPLRYIDPTGHSENEGLDATGGAEGAGDEGGAPVGDGDAGGGGSSGSSSTGDGAQTPGSSASGSGDGSLPSNGNTNATASGTSSKSGPQQTGNSSNTIIVSPNGGAIPVPNGASGPIPANTGKGVQYVGGSGGYGFSPNCAGVRIMEPLPPRYPNGYVVYMNANGQTINPYTGRTIPPTDPWAHVPLP